MILARVSSASDRMRSTAKSADLAELRAEELEIRGKVRALGAHAVGRRHQTGIAAAVILVEQERRSKSRTGICRRKAHPYVRPGMDLLTARLASQFELSLAVSPSSKGRRQRSRPLLFSCVRPLLFRKGVK